MTAQESIDFLFRCRMEGQADVDKLASSVRDVSGATAMASDSLASLERALAALQETVVENTAALNGMGTGFDNAAGGATRLAGGARVATAELRMLEGAMPIRAAGQFLAQFQALNSVMSAAFPIFGAVALVGAVDQILEKTGLLPKAWDPVKEAQEDSLRILKQQSSEYDRMLEKLKRLRLDEYERTHGKEARQLFEAQEKDFKAGSTDHQQIERLQSELEALRRIAGATFAPLATGDPTMALAASQLGSRVTRQDSYFAGLAGLVLNEGDQITPTNAETAKALTAQIEGAIRNAQVAQEVTRGEASDDRAKVSAEEKKKAAEDAAKLQREIAQSEREAANYRRSALESELTLLGRVNVEYQHRLELVKSQHALDLTNEGRAAALKNAVDHLRSDDRAAMGRVVEDNARGWELRSKFTADWFKKQIEQGKKDIDSELKVLFASDDIAARDAQRALSGTVRTNAYAVRAGTMSVGQAAQADQDARVATAKEVFDLETQHLHLIDDEDQRNAKYAEARKKRDEEIYQAAVQYETQLAELREADLRKYEQMSNSLFDAIHSRTTNQWFRNFAVGQERQVFTNVAAPVLQQAGHMLGSALPNTEPFTTLLHGTVLDPANADPAKQTARNTGAIFREVHDLRGDLKGVFTGNNNPDTPVTAGGPGSASSSGLAADLYSLPLSHTLDPLTLFGSDVGGWTAGGSTSTGVGASLFNSASHSMLSQIFSGTAALGSNPLAAVFTGQAGGPGWGANLTTGQQVGAGLSLATMLAGGGLSIASGISQGGVGGFTKAASSGLGMAAALDPEPLSKTILGVASAVTGLVGALFGTGPQQRSNNITNELSSNQYLAPTALNVTQSMGGNYEDFDAHGNLRVSTMSAVPTVAEPYITSRVVNGQRQYYDAPGNVTAPYSGSATGTGNAPVASTTPIVIQAMDSQSFAEFANRNQHTLGETVATHLDNHNGRLAEAIRFLSGTGH